MSAPASPAASATKGAPQTPERDHHLWDGHGHGDGKTVSMAIGILGSVRKDVQVMGLEEEPGKKKEVIHVSMPSPAQKRAQARHIVNYSEPEPPPVISASSKALAAAKARTAGASAGGKPTLGKNKWTSNKGNIGALLATSAHRKDLNKRFKETSSRAGYKLTYTGMCKATADLVYMASLGGEIDTIRKALKPALDALEAGETPMAAVDGEGAMEPEPGHLLTGWAILDPFGLCPLSQAAGNGHVEVRGGCGLSGGCTLPERELCDSHAAC